jgi:nitroimidazol reductase NimA-like FMN-containing flavoprotein (pyridoxamine 5'-phosphate oxidase superfamily)
MRRAEREIKDREAIEAILHKATVCRLGLCRNGVPYVVPLSFGYRDNVLYFHSAPEGRKIDTIRENPHVCFEVDIDQELVPGESPCAWTVRYRSVIGWGRARLVESVEEKRAALDVILDRYSQGRGEYGREALEKVAVIEVEIESMTGKQSGY